MIATVTSTMTRHRSSRCDVRIPIVICWPCPLDHLMCTTGKVSFFHEVSCKLVRDVAQAAMLDVEEFRLIQPAGRYIRPNETRTAGSWAIQSLYVRAER